VASQRSGVLQRLDEHGRAHWREVALRKEAAELDDLSSTRHGLFGRRP
jgi:hypothetical protein